MQEELNEYTYREEHKILPNDFGYTLETKVEDVICTCTSKPNLKKILPTPECADEVIMHPSCPRGLFTAFMRQLRKNEKPVDKKIIKKFHQHCDKFFKEKIEPLLRNFSYKVEPWMDHISTYNKQIEVLEYYEAWSNGIKWMQEWENNDYTEFCKSEKQVKKKTKMPKYRAISACPSNVKWIMGPVVYALEQLFKDFDGYKVVQHDSQGNTVGPAKTWQEMEENYEMMYNLGLDKIIDIDGSAWDSTQTYHMKYLINLIYNYLVDHDKIHHVDAGLFQRISTARYRKLTAKAYIDGKTFIVFSAIIDSTTFSGSMDTTFCNTITNMIVGDFTRTELELEPIQFKQQAAGDDYLGFIANETLLKYPVESTIRQIWEGLGLIPKHIIIGDYSDINFCSTNVIPYKIDGKQHFKIVRQLDRMFPLTHYSAKALHYSEPQLKYHYEQLAIGIENWATNMPFYSSYSKVFRQLSDSIPGHKQPTEPKTKSKMRFSDETVESYANYDALLFDVRKSTNQPDAESVCEFLLQKYGLTRTAISEHEASLMVFSAYDMTS